MPRVKPRVLCVGDAMLDVCVRRPDFRATQEDPGVRVLPHYDLHADSCSPGGAANLAANLAALGCEVDFVFPSAHDNEDVTLRRSLRSFDVNPVACGRLDRTTVKVRYYAADRLVARVDRNCDNQLSTGCAPEFCDAIRGMKYDAVVLSDYGKGAFRDADGARAWASLAPMAFADPYPGRADLWREVPLDTFVLNWHEAEDFLSSALGRPQRGDPSDFTARTFMVAGVKEHLPTAENVVVKCGALGSACAYENADDSGNPITSVGHVRPYRPAAVCDAQGAGDTYLAGYAAGRLRGLDIDEACRYASAAAGIAVSKPGTGVVVMREAAVAVRGDVQPGGVLPGGVAARLLAREYRAYGLVVGYTNGCFDGRLHAGHRHVVREAAARCDVLFVGVDSDERVRRLKGPSRPAVPQAERAAAVAALSGVCAAFVFDCDPAGVLTKLDPDFVFKGGDYDTDNMPELAAARAAGWAGEFVNVGTAEAESTTEFLERVR